VAGCCVHAPYEIPGCIKCGEFLENLSNYELLKMDSDP
jgi:hypothetical protein